ncbi:glutaredoxin-1 [Aptenodytes patagonicus]|uniref:glutaredoxin-1 n=1 Tax=Aptenodytes patagonicus TaxID=9234 RepID=UPI003FA12758
MADRYVKGKIRNDGVTLFVEKDSTRCKNVEEMFKKYNFVPGGLKVVDITGKEDVQDYLQQRTKQSAPHVFIGKQCIGGLSILESCELPRMLQRIGALK